MDEIWSNIKNDVDKCNWIDTDIWPEKKTVF